MNELNRYDDQVIEHNYIDSEPIHESGNDSMSEMIGKILRRWYIVLSLFIVISLAGIPAIWFLIKPEYDVTAAIRVKPILTNVLSGEADSGGMGSINVFMNTQAQIITSNSIVQGVADDLTKKDLSFFNGYTQTIDYKLKQLLTGTKTKPEISTILKDATSNEVITARLRKNTELIAISMNGPDPAEAKQIVNSFIREYMAVEVSSATKGDDQNLSILENEQTTVAAKVQQQREAIHKLAQEFGDTKLDTRHQMKLDRVSSLLASLTQYEADRIRLQAKVQLLEQNKSEQKIGPEEMLQMRDQHIKTDPTVSGLVANIEQLEQALIVDRQLLTPTNPEIKFKVELIEKLNNRLQTRRDESGKAYDKLVEERLARTASADLDIARAELEAIKTYEQTFREILSQEDTETIGLGRKQLAIQELQDDLALTKELYTKIARRINDLEMERKRAPRISVAWYAEVASVTDKRLKLTIALLFGAMACGAAAAFLMSKADKSMYLPNDMTKKISIRIIGTTTCTDRMNKSLLPKMLVEDYQTIRANIDLLNNNGEPTPRKLVITSSGSGDGKTTLAINLATSMAKSGKKVLLIDGDMRKPDIAHSLGLPKGTRGLHDFLFGKELKKVVYRMPSMRLDILASDAGNVDCAYELLASPLTRQYLNSECDYYDHVIIDTPPVLAYPDALLWAKMADAVILSSFAGQTNLRAFRETTERLAQINVKVLGSVMNNVRVDNSYNQFGYSYSSRKSSTSRKNKRSAKRNHLLSEDDKNNELNRKPYKTV